MWASLERFLTDGPSPEQLSGAKNRIRTDIARVFSRHTLLAPTLARVFATNEDETSLMTLFRGVQSVHRGQVIEAAQTLFQEENASVGILRAAPVAVPEVASSSERADTEVVPKHKAHGGDSATGLLKSDGGHGPADGGGGH